MLASKQFLRDFAYIANLYGWDADDVEDAKAQTGAHPELRLYWTQLAAAHRAGYKQSRDNNYMRLGRWLQRQEIYVHAFPTT
ncbi:hypothetical protein [Massilia agri]|uniref:Helicase-associated domain-containing protein n=1 Tax=Massilia agri TaxID=1886785 RepID=A0ABT2ASW4_9BURK|nr:hypothetical protein [Massilia agri]MCS0599334.1 hypothetical protein [Massilia agri]